MKTIVIPSDFSLESVQAAELIVRSSKEEINLIFTHLFHVADDIQDLLFSSYRKKEYDFVSGEFHKECRMLKDLYPDILKTARVEFFYGNKLAAFKNFLEYNQVDCIAYSESYGIPKISKSSIDALPVVRKAGLPLLDTDQLSEAAFSKTGYFL